MKAMVVNNWGEKSVLQSRPEPRPGPGEAVLRVRAAGVGLTLLNMRSGSFGGATPRVMGHELGGDIVALGAGTGALALGDRCAVYFYLTCGRCRWCRGGRETLCEKHGGYVGVHRDGGFAEYVCLPAENFLPIPQGLSYEAAAIATDAVNTNWHCMRERARINTGAASVLFLRPPFALQACFDRRVRILLANQQLRQPLADSVGCKTRNARQLSYSLREASPWN